VSGYDDDVDVELPRLVEQMHKMKNDCYGHLDCLEQIRWLLLLTWRELT
jgi:hypothetical protein